MVDLGQNRRTFVHLFSFITGRQLSSQISSTKLKIYKIQPDKKSEPHQFALYI